MSRISEASKLFFGIQEATKAYMGTNLVWELVTTEVPYTYNATAIQNNAGFLLTSAVTKTQLTASLNSQPRVGNLIIVSVNIDKSSGAINTPAGWTKTAEYVSTSTSLVMFHKVVTSASADQSVTISWATARAAAWAIQEYDCASAVFEGAVVTAINETARTATTLTYTAIAKNSLAVLSWGVDSASFALIGSSTEPVNGGTGWIRNARNIGLADSSSSQDNGGASVVVDAKVVNEGVSETVTLNHPSVSDQTAMIIARFTATGTSVAPVDPPVEEPPATPVATVQGVEVGGVTSDSAVISYDLSSSVDSRLLISSQEDFSSNLIYSDTQAASTSVKTQVSGLQPAQQYYWRVEAGGQVLTQTTGKFRTTPVIGQAGNFEIVVASCGGQNTSPYISASMSNAPTYEAMAKLNPLFFLNMGDEHYRDYAGTDVNVRLTNRKQSRNIARRRLLNLNCWQIFNHDDHDGCGNNWGGAHVGVPTMLQAYSATFPHYPLVSGTMAQTTDVGRVKFIVLDPRSKRVTGTILGTEQREWAVNLLATTEARVVVISTSIPWIGAGTTGSDYEDNWQAFPADRQIIAQAITAYETRTQGRVILVAGDAHMIAMDDGTNSQYDPAKTGNGPPVYQFAPMDCSSSSKGGPYNLGIYNNHRYQFGRMVFTDDGEVVTVTSEGHRVDVSNPAFPTTVVVSHTVTVPAYVEPVEEPPVEEPEPTGLYDQANLYDQWKASDASSAGEGGLVTTWTGRVNGIQATQATDSRKPRYYGGVGGLPGLLFSGSLLNTPKLASPAKMTIYAKVYHATAPTGTQTVASQDEGGNARSWHFGVNATSKARIVHFNDGVGGISHTLAGTLPTSTWQILQAARNVDPATRAGTFVVSNNADNSTDLAISTTLLDSLYVSIGGRGGYSELMNGYITELRIYTAYHDAATRALVRAEMNA